MDYILALQTAEYPNSVALLDGKGKVLDERTIETKERSEEILPELVNAVLQKGGIKLSEVKKIAVCLGPGSYTGLRVGVAFAKGLAQFGEVQIVGVDDFDVLSGAVSENGIILFDAKNERVYYKIKDKIKVDYLVNVLAEIKPGKSAKFFGSGAIANENYIDTKFGKDLVSDRREDHILTAALTGKAALTKGKEMSVIEVKPIYVQEARITMSKK